MALCVVGGMQMAAAISVVTTLHIVLAWRLTCAYVSYTIHPTSPCVCTIPSFLSNQHTPRVKGGQELVSAIQAAKQARLKVRLLLN